jgi:hypothetical protein
MLLGKQQSRVAQNALSARNILCLESREIVSGVGIERALGLLLRRDRAISS